MSKLHLISQPMTAEQLQASIARYIAAEDPLLFIGDAVVVLLKHPHRDLLLTLDNSIYALTADLKSRGLADKIPDLIHSCHDDKMVELTLTSSQVISW